VILGADFEELDNEDDDEDGEFRHWKQLGFLPRGFQTSLEEQRF
jgi:hypothetical protein